MVYSLLPNRVILLLKFRIFVKVSLDRLARDTTLSGNLRQRILAAVEELNHLLLYDFRDAIRLLEN